MARTLSVLLLTIGLMATADASEGTHTAESLRAMDTADLIALAEATGPDALDAAHIHHQTGERLFAEERYDDALRWYLAALEVAPTDSSFTRYKIAWCHHRLDNNDAAVTEALSLIADLEASAADTRAQQLRAETLRDLPRFYTSAGREKEGRRHYRAIGERALWREATR